MWLVVTLAGCWNRQSMVQYSGAAQVTSAGLRGGEVEVTSGINGIQLGLGAFGHEVERPMDPNPHLSLGIDARLRASLFGLLIAGDDHPLEHWFDLGAEVGGGVGAAYPTELKMVGHGFFGAWANIGLWSSDWYPLLVVSIDQIGYGAPWIDETQVSIGLAWGQRWLADLSHFHD